MKWIASYIFLLFITIGKGQEDILPDLTGEDLLLELVNKYKPSTVLNYSSAREYMFENLQLQKDTVEGIYTGFKIHLPEGVPSRSWTFERGINTEHIYPRSKGASDGNAFSDLHHLKPSKANVNSSRLNHPYKEIDDNITKKWFRKGGSTLSIPEDNIDEYSELDSFVTSSGFILGDFEPRESVKGDIARAVFYFFTMYNAEAMAADPDYFSSMQEDLCRWHVMDKADEDEIRLTELISIVQSDKVNPFVLDCSLALRTYCSDMNLQCDENTVPTIELSDDKEFSIYPNPSNGPISIKSNSKIDRIFIYNSSGQKVYESQKDDAEMYNISLELPFGLYSVMLIDQSGQLNISRLIIQN